MSRFFTRLGLGDINSSDAVTIGGENEQIIQIARRTTADSSGNELIISAGGATLGATNKSGGSMILQSGATTGTGKSMFITRVFTTAITSGTTDNTPIDVNYLRSPVFLENNITTDFIDVDLSHLQTFSVFINYSILVTNETDYQIRSSLVAIAAINKAGVYSTNIDDVSSSTFATSGTLTNTWSINTGTDKITIRINVNSSLSGTKIIKMYNNINNYSYSNVTFLI